MTKRKSTGKKARFEVFKRDNFTCQYCGGRPPEAVLVVDHMTPVKLGGTNELTNLITSCEPCNQGKAARPLTQIHPRPDADLMYLEVQQEIAELQRFQRSEQAKKREIDNTIALIQQSFTDITDLKWQPHDQPIRLMLAKYDPTTVKDAIEALGRKFNHMMSLGEDLKQFEWVPYMWSVCRNMSIGEIDKPKRCPFTRDERVGLFETLLTIFEEESDLLDLLESPWSLFDFLEAPPSAPLLRSWHEVTAKEYLEHGIGFDYLATPLIRAIIHFEPLRDEFLDLVFSEPSQCDELRKLLVTISRSREEIRRLDELSEWEEAL